MFTRVRLTHRDGIVTIHEFGEYATAEQAWKGEGLDRLHRRLSDKGLVHRDTAGHTTLRLPALCAAGRCMNTTAGMAVVPPKSGPAPDAVLLLCRRCGQIVLSQVRQATFTPLHALEQVLPGVQVTMDDPAAQLAAKQEQQADEELFRAEVRVWAQQVAHKLHDPAWRTLVAEQASISPAAVLGVVAGIGAIDPARVARDVNDIAQLMAMLPPWAAAVVPAGGSVGAERVSLFL